MRELRLLLGGLPGFLRADPDDTFSQVVEKYRLDGKIGEGLLPADLEPCAQDAADLCPVQIITIDTT